ncbi:MAG: hypothetical protein IT307_10290, partial [Chloroflexi bacterium]|nr:hypothetical protein [Chloroflexota bacterium]
SALVAACLLMTTALLVKPIVAAAVAPIGVACLSRMLKRRFDLALAVAVSLLLAAAVILIVGPGELYDQVIKYRVGSREAEGWSLIGNMAVLADELRWEGVGGPMLVVVSLLACVWRWRLTLPALSWAGVTALLLLMYSPLMEKHAVLLIPPLGLLVGTAAALGVRAVGAPARGGRAVGLAMGATLAASYLVGAPAVLGRDRQLVATAANARNDVYADDVALLAALAGPDEFVIVDEPYVAFLARRMMPPMLADPTSFRIRSGTLTGSDVVDAAERYDVRAMLLWSDGLRDLKKFGDWTDEQFQAVKLYERGNRKDRAVLVRAGAATSDARTLARGRLELTTVDFARRMRLTAAGIDSGDVRSGGAVAVGTEWEALSTLPVDYHVLVMLEAADGKTVAQIERTLGGGGVGTSDWQPGRWVVRTVNLPIPPRTPPGQYRVRVGLYDSKARESLLASSGASGDAADIATLRVR